MKKRILLLAIIVWCLFISVNTWSREPVITEKVNSEATCRITANFLPSRTSVKAFTALHAEARGAYIDNLEIYYNIQGQLSTIGPNPLVWEVPVGTVSQIAFFCSLSRQDWINVFVDGVVAGQTIEPDPIVGEIIYCTYQIDTSKENVEINFWFTE